MDWKLKLKCCAFALASVALGLSVVYIQHQREAEEKKKKKPQSPSQQDIAVMAATSEIEATPNPVAQIITTMEQLNVSQQASESPQPPEEELLDRDSANQSPSDFLSGNLHSDSHSESSNDSGKGGSDCPNTNGDAHAFRCEVITPPMSPHQTAALAPLPERLFVYEFEIPQQLCGLLIGKYGAYVNQIKIKTGASLLIKDYNRRSKICAVEGTKNEIDAALALIRQKFPLKRYPQVTLQQLNISPEATIAPMLPDSIQLVLPPEVSCEIVISAVVAPNHIFLQQITHPTYPSLERLDQCMAQCYNEFVTPGLPRPIRPNMICAAQSMGGWYRAKVVGVYPSTAAIANGEVIENGEIICEDGVAEKSPEEAVQSDVLEIDDDCEVDICFVDYGGYSRVPASSLRQIRADFMTLPFQAIECLLANVAPTNVDEGWTNEAFEEFENITRDRLLQAQAVAYSMEGLPLVYLYQNDPTEEALINRQLVNRKVAQWVEPQVVSN